MYTKRFEQICKHDTAIAGGKGASLGEMTQAGIRVPSGFIILTCAFDQILDNDHLESKINSILYAVDYDSVTTINNASKKIRALIERADMPDALINEIKLAFSKLDAEFVAVRSSATSEDSAGAAWAGQLETYLNTTKNQLFNHVKKCWSSLFTTHAILYRFEKGLQDAPISVAVVIQKMVNSEKSGIAFSVHPVTQDRNQLIIEAGLGLGEAIVSGEITPDSYIVEKDSNKLLECRTSAQIKSLIRGKNGKNAWRELGDDGSKTVLEDKDILALAKIIQQIEEHYGFPVDVEWAYENANFYITQSRPITTL